MKALLAEKQNQVVAFLESVGFLFDLALKYSSSQQKQLKKFYTFHMTSR